MPDDDTPTDIPERERFVHENPEVLESLERGMEQASKGEVRRKDELTSVDGFGD